MTRMPRMLMNAQKEFGLGAHFKADIALARDEASRFLPWIIALMVYLTALVLTGSFTLNHAITATHDEQANSFSVHLPHSGDKETAGKALAVIKAFPGVESAEMLGVKKLEELVEPWFGRGDTLADLPLPTVIEARISPGASLDYGALKSRIDGVAQGATLDDHKKWLSQFSSCIAAVRTTLLCIALLIICTTASIVIFACKTSLKIHRATVNLLHRLGAMDDYIASQFQHYACFITLKGAFVGSGFAAITLLALHGAGKHLDSPLFPASSLSLTHWLILFGLPVLMGLLALTAARLAVLKALRRIP